MRLKRKYQGLHVHRHSREPLEQCFSKAWQKANDSTKTTLLAQLLHTGSCNEGIAEPSKRDFEVAATVIQWLGSSVGQGFIREVVNAQ